MQCGQLYSGSPLPDATGEDENEDDEDAIDAEVDGDIDTETDAEVDGDGLGCGDESGVTFSLWDDEQGLVMPRDRSRGSSCCRSPCCCSSCWLFSCRWATCRSANFFFRNIVGWWWVVNWSVMEGGWIEG